jgi:hypothetical protein
MGEARSTMKDLDDNLLALSVMQPWGSLIAFGQKALENRSWAPPISMIGKRFAIHASKKLDLDAFHDLREGFSCSYDRSQFPYATPRDFPTMAIIAITTLSAVVRSLVELDEYCLARGIVETGRHHRWFVGPLGYVLTYTRRLETPVPCKGALGFWRVPGDVRASVVEQLR